MWLVYAFSAAAIWGLDYSLSEKIFQSKISPITLLTLQTLFGAIIFFIVGINGQLKTDIKAMILQPSLLCLVLFTVITFNLGNLSVFLAIQAKNATLTGLIELCYPIFTALFTLMLFKENYLTLPVIVGATLIFAGAVIIGYFS